MKCKFCGNTNESELMEIWGYDWDSDDDDALSVSRVIGHRCEYMDGCTTRILTTGNPEGLREIVRIGYEDLAREIVDKAKSQLHQFAELAQEQARTADLVARESGYGVTH